MTNDGVFRQAESRSQRDHVRGLGVKTIVERRGRLRKTSPPDVHDVRVELATEALADEIPGNGRTRDAGQNDDWIASWPVAAVSQIMLPDPVSVYIGTIKKRGHRSSMSRVNVSVGA